MGPPPKDQNIDFFKFHFKKDKIGGRESDIIRFHAIAHREIHAYVLTTTSSALLGKHFEVFTPSYIGTDFSHHCTSGGIQLAYDVIRVRRPGPPGHQDCPYRNYIIIRIRCYNADSPDIILQPNCLETLFQSSFLIHRPQPSPHTPLKHLNIP